MKKEKNTRPCDLVWTEDLVQKFWNGFAYTRLTELSFARKASRILLNPVWQHLSPKGTHIDYGAGDGHLVEELIKNGLNTAALEPSAERRARIWSRLKHQDNFIGFVNDEAIKEFDVLFLLEVIEHVLERDLGNFLNRLKNYIRPGGTIIVSTPNKEDLDLNKCYCPVCNTLFHRWQHQRSFSSQSLKSIMELAGYKTLVIHEIEFSEYLFEPYKEYFKGVRPIPPRIDSSKDQSIRRLAKAKNLFINFQNRLRRAYNEFVVKNQDSSQLYLKNEDIEAINTSASSLDIPSYLYDILEDKSTLVGSGNNLLYIGKKSE